MQAERFGFCLVVETPIQNMLWRGPQILIMVVTSIELVVIRRGPLYKEDMVGKQKVAAPKEGQKWLMNMTVIEMSWKMRLMLIALLDNMLDWLHGAKVFSKINGRRLSRWRKRCMSTWWFCGKVVRMLDMLTYTSFVGSANSFVGE